MRSRRDEWKVVGIDGKQVTVHPAYKLQPSEWNNLPDPVKGQLIEMRRQYRENKRRRTASQSDSYSYYNGSNASQPYHGMGYVNIIPPPPPPPMYDDQSRYTQQSTSNRQNNNRYTDDNCSHASHISAVTMHTSNTPPPPNNYGGGIMGGRNDQQRSKSRNPNINNVITKRTLSQTISKMPESAPNTVAQNEADSNADTCCLGRNFIPLSYTNKSADVYPYHDAYKPLENIPIVSGATAFDHEDGNTYILVIHEALYYGTKMSHSLINPNQIRHNGLDFFDNPPCDKEIYFEADESVHIPMDFKGTKFVISSRVPTSDELATCEHLHITSDREWNPSEVDLRSLYKISEVRKAKRQESRISSIEIDQRYSSMVPFDCHLNKVSSYDDPLSDQSLLHTISPSLVQLKECMISAIQTEEHELETYPGRRTFVNKEKQAQLSAESLAELWHIGPKRAQATLDATTQNGVRSAILPISRRYRSDRMYNVKKLKGRFATDIFFTNTKSLHQNTCCQVYSHKNGLVVCFPFDTSSGDNIGDSLLSFIHDYGSPEHLTFDGFSSQVGKNTRFHQALRKYGIMFHVSSPRRPNENPAEGTIRQIKRRFYRILHRLQVPRRLWDYLIIWICETACLSVSSSKYAAGRTPLEMLTGETPDISEYLDFGFYDWVLYRSNAGLGELSIGRWIGVSHKIGQLMSYWILPISGKPISCVTVQRLTNAEKTMDEYKNLMKKYDETIAKVLEIKDDEVLYPPESPEWNRMSTDEDDPAFRNEFQAVISDDGIPHVDDHPAQQKDEYLDMNLGLPRGPDSTLEHAVVKRRAVDVHGNPIGVASKNPMTDTRLYDIEYLDGSIETISANVIAECLLSQVDSEGHRQLMLDESVEHRCT